MMNRIRLKTMPLEAIGSILKRERRNTEDIYLPLSRLSIEARDLQAPLDRRYRLVLDPSGSHRPVAFTRTSLRQFAHLAQVPLGFLEKMPPALGLNVLRCMFSLAVERRDRSYLLRLRGTPRGGRLRAILPGSYLRFDDDLVYQELLSAGSHAELRPVSLHVTEDLFATRLVLPREFHLGTRRSPDVCYAGIDIRSSETGAHPVQVRQVLFRLLCENGMTRVTHARTTRISRLGLLDREGFRDTLREALATALRNGEEVALRLADSRFDYVEDLEGEVGRIFKRFELGSRRGRLWRWVMEHLRPLDSLLGVRRFDIIQAFTAVAQTMEHSRRLRIEDAMTGYLLQETEESAPGPTGRAAAEPVLG